MRWNYTSNRRDTMRSDYTSNGMHKDDPTNPQSHWNDWTIDRDGNKLEDYKPKKASIKLKIYDVIKELEKDKTKMFMIKDYGYWGTDYETQLPSAIITMNMSKIVFYNNGETVKLGFAILNCEFEEVQGINKYR